MELVGGGSDINRASPSSLINNDGMKSLIHSLSLKSSDSKAKVNSVLNMSFSFSRKSMLSYGSCNVNILVDIYHLEFTGTVNTNCRSLRFTVLALAEIKHNPPWLIKLKAVHFSIFGHPKLY